MFWRIKDWYNNVRTWFRYNFNKKYFKTVKALRKSRPWDFAYFQEVMLAWFEHQAVYFEKSQITVEWEKTVQELKLAKSLLEIITEKRDIRECNHFSGKPDNMLVYVNTKNAARFYDGCVPKNWDFEDPWSGPIRKNALYKNKAHKLLYRLLEERSRTWWD